MKLYVCQHEGGAGCPEVDGGPHYFAHLDPQGGSRICIDCGEREADGDVS